MSASRRLNAFGLGSIKNMMPILVCGSFLPAALFLFAMAWNPASAEETIPEEVDTSLLLRLDTPMPPSPRSLDIADDSKPMEIMMPDLATELFNWTFTCNCPKHHHRPPPPKPRPPHEHHHRTPHH